MHNFFPVTSLVFVFLLIFSHSAQAFRIVGSTAIYGFVTQVAERLGQTTPHKAPIVEATGSGGGLKLFCGGSDKNYPLMANSSRPMSSFEHAYCKANGVNDVIELKIGYDGIVIGTRAQNPVFPLTRIQLSQALSENGGDNSFKNWSDIDKDLPARPIKVLGPTITLATREVFEDLVIRQGCLDAGNSEKMCTKTIREDGPFIEVAEQENVIIQKLSLSEDAIGFVSYGYYVQNPEKITPLPIDGVLPSHESIADGNYPLSRPLYLYVKGQALEREDVQAFLGELFAQHASGPHGYLAEKGLVALPEDQRKNMLKKIARVRK